MQERRCPDCGVTLEAVEFSMYDAGDPHVKTGESRAGWLGKLGMNERKSVNTFACPDCGLLRQYVDPDE